MISPLKKKTNDFQYCSLSWEGIISNGAPSNPNWNPQISWFSTHFTLLNDDETTHLLHMVALINPAHSYKFRVTERPRLSSTLAYNINLNQNHYSLAATQPHSLGRAAEMINQPIYSSPSLYLLIKNSSQSDRLVTENKDWPGNFWDVLSFQIKLLIRPFTL